MFRIDFVDTIKLRSDCGLVEVLLFQKESSKITKGSTTDVEPIKNKTKVETIDDSETKSSSKRKQQARKQASKKQIIASQ